MFDPSTIRSRLAALAGADPGFRVFGADHHHYELGDPLSLAELARLETELGVRLPEDYRSFLAEVGDGGAGPGFGLEPLERSVSSVQHQRRSEFGGADGPVPTHPAAIDFPLERPLLGPDGLESWSGPRLKRGLVPLGGYGCALDPHLVVSGPRRGEVWIDGTSSDGGFFPFTVFDTGFLHDERRGYPETFAAMRCDEPLTFGDWYDDWLRATESVVADRSRDLRL